MYSLAFDTTVNTCAVALFENTRECGRFCQEMEFGQAESLMTAIPELLTAHGLKFADLSLLTVCTGPGSFTGVRASLSAARAFALAAPTLTVCGVSAFEAYAADLADDERAEINAVLIETKRDDYYLQLYDSALRRLEEPAAAAYPDIIRRLQGHKVSFCGDAVERFLSKPSGLSLHAIKFYQQPPLERLALCGLAKFSAKRTDFPKPLYIKAPDVCIK